MPQARVSLVHDNDWSDVVLKVSAQALFCSKWITFLDSMALKHYMIKPPCSIM